jgi:hypothetical protein
MPKVLPLTEEPEWLKDINQDNIETHAFDICKVLENSLYYPSCGTDGLPITNFSGGIHSFIYVDYAITRDILYSKFNFKIIASRRLTPSDLTPNGWQPNWELADGDPTAYLNPSAKPFCEWIIFEINHVKCSLLFLYADGVATYQALYKNHKIAPRIVALIQTGVIHGNWTNYSDPNTILHRTIFSNTQKTPEYLLHGGYYQLPGDKLYFRQPCWPEYSEKIISIPRGLIFDAPFNRFFKGNVILWKNTNSLNTETINKIEIRNYSPSDTSVPTLQIWHNLYSELVKNENSIAKIPNPLMFQYGSTLKYIDKIFIFKWHLAYAEIQNKKAFVENFLQMRKANNWDRNH